MMLRRFFKETVDKIPLGRWERTGDKMNAIKVTWANMDHCGSCGAPTIKRDDSAKDIITSVPTIDKKDYPRYQ